MKRDDPIGLTLIVGVPRSGTSVLHALACTDVSTNPYVGEASHFRFLVQAYRNSKNLFEPHTKFYFSDKNAHKTFHQDIIASALNEYAKVLGNPSRLVLKDPLISTLLNHVADLVADLRVVLILRHPCDVIASRLVVQDKAGIPRDIDRMIAEHNDILSSMLNVWKRVSPHVVTYPMLVEDDLEEIRTALNLPGINAANLWKRDKKRFETDMQETWKTPLFGAGLKLQTETRNALEPNKRTKIHEACMPVCKKVLKKARLWSDEAGYWNEI